MTLWLSTCHCFNLYIPIWYIRNMLLCALIGVIDGCNVATFKVTDNTGPTDIGSTTHTLIPGTTSMDNCQQQCIRIPTCQAFAYVGGTSPGCFVYTTDAYKTQTSAKPGYTLKTLIARCPTAGEIQIQAGRQWRLCSSYLLRRTLHSKVKCNLDVYLLNSSIMMKLSILVHCYEILLCFWQNAQVVIQSLQWEQ